MTRSSSSPFVEAVSRFQTETTALVTDTVEQAQTELAQLVESVRSTVNEAVQEASSNAGTAAELVQKLAYASIGLAVVVQEQVAERAAHLPVVTAIRDIAAR